MFTTVIWYLTASPGVIVRRLSSAPKTAALVVVEKSGFEVMKIEALRRLLVVLSAGVMINASFLISVVP